MKYPFEDFISTYNVLHFSDKPIVVFEDHNMAFPIWGYFSNKNNKALNLISFDTHADTRPPFTKVLYTDYPSYLSNPGEIFKKEVLCNYNCSRKNFNFEHAFCLAKEFLQHDEHIQTACYFRYICTYHIFCSLDDCELEGRQEMDRKDGFFATYHKKNDIISLSEQELTEICKEPYVLDFDLDFFTTREQLDNSNFFKNITPLIKNAVCITIAREPHYFDLEKEDKDFSNEEALQKLLQTVKGITNTSFTEDD